MAIGANYTSTTVADTRIKMKASGCTLCGLHSFQVTTMSERVDVYM